MKIINLLSQEELMPKSKKLSVNQNKFLLYTDSDGQIKVEVFIKDETVWITQKAMAQLFGVESHTITYHLKEIYKTGELDGKATARKIRVVKNILNWVDWRKIQLVPFWN